MKNAFFKQSCSVLVLLSVWCYFNNFYLADAFGAEILTNARRNESAEMWVQSRLANGETANLINNFPEKKQRVLSSKFIKELISEYISDTDKASRAVRVSNAIITDPLTLSDMTIPIVIELTYCEFEDDLIFSRSHFEKPLSFEGSSIINADFQTAVFEKPANFKNLIIGDNANFSKTEFSDSAIFSGTKARRLVLSDAQFFHPNSVAAFDGISVGDIAEISNTIFSGSVSFVNSDIHHLRAVSAKFVNYDGRANFDNMNVNDRAVFDQAEFRGGFSFSGSTVHNFEAKYSKFIGTKASVSFYQAVFTGDANFYDTFFAGSVHFVDAHVAGRFNLARCRFTHKSKKVLFRGMTVGDSFYLNNAEFSGWVYFTGASINYLEASRAIFTNPEGITDFTSMKVQDTARLNYSEFHGPVWFVDLEVWRLDANNVKFRNHTFANGMRVKGTLGLNGAEFFNKGIFDHTDVGGRLEAYNVVTHDGASLQFIGIRVRDKAVFNLATFKGSVNLSGSEISFLDAYYAEFGDLLYFNGAEIKHLTARGAQFKGGKAEFDGMRVADSADFEEADFNGRTTFSGAEINYFSFQDAVFKNDARFDGMKIADTAEFENANFHGETDFRELETQRFKAKDIKFHDNEKPVFFDGIKVSDSADFTNAQFDGSVSFDGSVFGRLNARAAQFNNLSIAASFRGMRVHGHARFSEATFGGWVFFQDAEIGGSLEAVALNCTNESGRLFFDSIRVNGTAEFINAVFSRYVSFRGAHIKLFRARAISFVHSEDKEGKTSPSNEFVLTNAISQEVQIEGKKGSSLISISKLDLNGLETKVRLLIERLKIGDLDAPNLRVEGQLELKSVAIQNHIDFRNSQLRTLNLENVEILSRQEQPSLHIQGMQFQNMQVSSHSEAESEKSKPLSNDNLKYLAAESPFSYLNLEYLSDKARETMQLSYDNLMHLVDKSSFSVLEQLYTHLGDRKYKEYRDQLFIRRKNLEFGNADDFLVSTFHPGWYILAGYGRKPSFTFGWMIFFCIVGCLVFRKREWMVPKELGKIPDRYNPVWYSFDLFFPFIDLQTASVWMPKDDRKWSKFYMRCHQVLGWVLLPIFLATWTGIIK